MNNWTSCGVVLEGGPINVGGINPWSFPWEPLEQPPVELPHPAYASQLHTMLIYEIDHAGKKIIFAAGEVSANIWGFYVPAQPDDVVAEQREKDYLDNLELERHLFAWALMRSGSVPQGTAQQWALQFYPFEPSDKVCRGSVFHDSAWQWAMVQLHGNMYWRERPDLVSEPPEYRQEEARFWAALRSKRQ